jgi:hypothetical protein
MNFPPTTFGELMVVLAGMFALGLGFYGLGRWLRSKGHGARLDRIDAYVTTAQCRVAHLLGPLAVGFVYRGRRGSYQRAIWNDPDAWRQAQHNTTNSPD